MLESWSVEYFVPVVREERSLRRLNCRRISGSVALVIRIKMLSFFNAKFQDAADRTNNVRCTC